MDLANFVALVLLFGVCVVAVSWGLLDLYFTRRISGIREMHEEITAAKCEMAWDAGANAHAAERWTDSPAKNPFRAARLERELGGHK